VTRTNLPVQVTSFVGREEDVKRVCALVGEHRVVTLTGVGGVGKTRLALQVAAALVTQAVERPGWATASIAEQALSAPGTRIHSLRAIVMGEAAWAAVRIGDIDRAQALLEASLEAQRRGARFSASVWT
jgi:Mrp family chromosome partitioning ATPase